MNLIDLGGLAVAIFLAATMTVAVRDADIRANPCEGARPLIPAVGDEARFECEGADFRTYLETAPFVGREPGDMDPLYYDGFEDEVPTGTDSME